jgi:glycosyltransferase involved in cell wall biosynthesis
MSATRTDPRDGVPAASADRKMFGVLVTFRRPELLSTVFDRLREQDRRLDRVVVVDNDPSAESEEVARSGGAGAFPVEYLPMAENLGSAGGVAAGMSRVLEVAADDDWILLLDDDDPPPTSTIVGELERFGAATLERDARTAGVGLAGARFDWRRGRLRRVPDRELDGPVALDYLPMGHVALYRVRAVREAGPYLAPLFYASDIEYGLRLRRAGYSLYAPGELLLERRAATGRLGLERIRPNRRLEPPGWRRYYSLRNSIYVLRSYGHSGVALRVTLSAGLGKPLANLLVSPRVALSHLALNLKACWHGWSGRMGRVVEPDGRSREG